jgi:Fe-Mn family superoxide dismutase
MKNSLVEFRTLILEAEKNKDSLILDKLSYARSDLAPSLSEKNIDIHYGILAKTYVDRYNAGEGDAEFNRAGAILHNIFFSQFKSSESSNKPFGASLELINKHYENFSNFKEEFVKISMSIQGSGWVYLSTSGKIKTIKNHAIFQDIILLIDWWEHAWFTDYGANKQKYINNIWRIIDWAVINDRINLKNS